MRREPEWLEEPELLEIVEETDPELIAIERSVDDFLSRLCEAKRDDDWTEPLPEHGDWRNDGAEGELRRRWWRRPLICADLEKTPHRLFNLGLSQERDDNKQWFSKITNESEGSIQNHRQYDRQQQLELAAFRLCLGETRKRLFDPIPKSSLSTLPRNVSEGIYSIVARCESVTTSEIAYIVSALRRACEPLVEFEIFIKQPPQDPKNPKSAKKRWGSRAPTAYRGHSIWCSDVTLIHDGRSFCLLRFEELGRKQDASRNSGRTRGCILTLLPETEEALKKEIARYQANLKQQLESAEDGESQSQLEYQAIPPHAKRFTRVNPYQAAREDGCSVKQQFFTKRKPRKKSRSSE